MNIRSVIIWGVWLFTGTKILSVQAVVSHRQEESGGNHCLVTILVIVVLILCLELPVQLGTCLDIPPTIIILHRPLHQLNNTLLIIGGLYTTS